MDGKSFSVSDACGEEIELINKKPLAIPTAFGERGRGGKPSTKPNIKAMSVWSTDSEHKAHLLNRLEDTRLTTSLCVIRKERHISERKFRQDVRTLRIRSARLSLPGDGETPRGATASRSTLSSRMSNRLQNGQSMMNVVVPERTPLTRPKTAPPMLTYRPQTVMSCILCSTVRNMAMKHRRMNSRTLHSTEDMTESFLLSLERHHGQGKLPDVIQTYLDHLPYCINARTNTVTVAPPQEISAGPIRVTVTDVAPLPAANAAAPQPATDDVAEDNVTSIISDDELEYITGVNKKVKESDNRLNQSVTNQTREKMEKVTIREDESGMTITQHEDIGDVTRTFAKDSVNWRLYNFLKAQREFNTRCPVPSHIAETNEKWCFDHSSAGTHRRRISVLPARRRSHHKKQK
ncbi:uncharacterized protein LOC135487933 [Lineus longissimus]|uniref:uncharacterized protein LOC135487933 n=1 Tax=Lineus longissimus TaxID=88925 RepID=UPI002B4E3758